MRWRRSRSIHITAAVIAFLGGVAVSRLWMGWYEVVIVGAALVGLVLFGLRVGIIIVLVLVFGLWRGETTRFSYTPLGQAIGTTVQSSGVIMDDPGPTKSGQTGFTVAIDQLNGVPAEGDIRVYAAGSGAYTRGYRVGLKGKLKPARGIVQAQMSFAQIQLLSDQISPLEQVRQRFFVGLRTVIPEPMSGLIVGLLIGARALLEESIEETFRTVGLTHIIAVSGSNLTIMTQAARRLLVGASQFAMTAISGWLIFTFLLIAGFGAPLVRAALVAGLGLAVSYYGYTPKPMTLISIPAFLTVAYRPDYLLLDAGWQLSFLAFIGIMVLGPLVAQRFINRPNAVNMLLVESVSAQVATLPFILAIFGNLSVVSLISNLIIVPMVPLAMLLGFVSGVAALFAPLASGWVALPATGLIGLMIGLAEWFSRWPYAYYAVKIPSWFAMVLYLVIALIILVLRKSTREKPALPVKDQSIFA